jgi:predicted DNA-binding protein
MSAATKQISAHLSPSTKRQLDVYTKRTGTKQAWVVEQALQHHFRALAELPLDVIVHPRLVITTESMQRVAEAIENPSPTPALRDLMRRGR